MSGVIFPRYLVAIIISGIVLLSFFSYSFLYSPVLNSDAAVKVLMAQFLHLPQDLYYWGEDRWGSLIPVIGHFLIITFGLKAVTAVSITYFLIRVAGFIGFQSLFKNAGSKIIFAIIYFLPPLRFIDVLWSAIGIEYSLIGILILLIKKLDVYDDSGAAWRNQILLFSISIFIALTLWVSDASLTTLILLLTILIAFHWKSIRIKKQLFFYTIFCLALSIIFIRYAKDHASNHPENYLKINSLREVIVSLGYIKTAVTGLLTFSVNELWMSIYSWLVIFLVLLTLILIMRNKVHLSRNARMWVLFFVLDAMLIFSLALMSKWVFINEANRRYFFGCYISLSVSLIILLENINLKHTVVSTIRGYVFLIIIIGAISTPYYFKFVWPKSLQSQLDKLSAFGRRGKIGVIGEYWNSYIIACVDPIQIKATPEDHDRVRNAWMAEEVFSQPAIYIIRDDWMNSFPDSLKQFGHVLYRDGNEFQIDHHAVCKYRK
jgi:hypothetical protein